MSGGATAVVSTTTITVTFSELNDDPAQYRNQRIRVEGDFVPPQPFSCAQERTFGMYWQLAGEDLALQAQGLERILRLVPAGTTMVVEGIWRQYEGLVGCEVGQIGVIWYLQAENIIEPNPLTNLKGTLFPTDFPMTNTPVLSITITPTVDTTTTPDIGVTPLGTFTATPATAVTASPTSGTPTVTPTDSPLTTRTLTPVSGTASPSPSPTRTQPATTSSPTPTRTPTAVTSPTASTTPTATIPVAATSTPGGGYPGQPPIATSPPVPTSPPYP